MSRRLRAAPPNNRVPESSVQRESAALYSTHLSAMPTPVLLEHLLDATKVRDVTELLENLSTERRLAWKPVGDNDNNLAIINLGSDPAAGVIERVTNAFDAVLEIEWNERGQPSNLISPRSAVEQWFGIRNGKLVNVDELRDPDIVDISKRIVVSLDDSERPDRPTVSIRDHGVGLKAEDFAASILSLNKSRKLRKLFLAGAFGQGGSTALAYSPYTLIISRAKSSPDGGAGRPRVNPLAFTIVRFNRGDTRIDKHGVYEYMIDHSTGQPITLTVPERAFSHGTLVRHVSMELGKFKSVLTSPTGSLWFLTHNYLFDPVLPFSIEERRSNSGRGTTRSVAGNHRLLTRGEHTEYHRSAILTFRDGQVTITWWVLSADGETARDRITQYVQVSKPIVITYNGQKQGDFPNTVIKTELKYPYLDRYIVTHVDCDKLDNESRRQLFPTTREALRDTAIGDDLRRLVVDTLGGDENLQRLDRERKQRYLSRVDSTAVESIRRRLASRVRNVLLVSAGGRGPRILPPDGGHTHPQRPPIPVQEPPTLLEVSSPAPRKVYAGRRFTIQFRTDADPAYFASPDTFIAVINPPSFGQYSGTTNVRDGYGTAYFMAGEDLEIGTKSALTLELRPRRAASLRATVEAEIAELPTPAGSGDGRIPTPNIEPIWVSEGDAFWSENRWNQSSVAKVVRSEDSIEVFVSADNVKLNSLIARAQRRDTATVDTIKDFYLEHISFHAMLAALDIDRSRGGDAGEEQVDAQAIEREQERELQRACQTVCGIAEDMFEVVAMHAVEEHDTHSTGDIALSPDDSQAES